MSPCPPPTRYSDRPIHCPINRPILHLILYRKPSSLLCIIAYPHIASLTALCKAFSTFHSQCDFTITHRKLPQYRYHSSLLHTYVKSPVPFSLADAILWLNLHYWIWLCAIQLPAFIHFHFFQYWSLPPCKASISCVKSFFPIKGVKRHFLHIFIQRRHTLQVQKHQITFSAIFDRLQEK